MKKGLIGMFLSAALTVGFALAASDVELFDREILSNSRNFTVHEGKFTPAGPDRAAVMEFPTADGRRSEAVQEHDAARLFLRP